MFQNSESHVPVFAGQWIFPSDSNPIFLYLQVNGFFLLIQIQYSCICRSMDFSFSFNYYHLIIFKSSGKSTSIIQAGRTASHNKSNPIEKETHPSKNRLSLARKEIDSLSALEKLQNAHSALRLGDFGSSK